MSKSRNEKKPPAQAPPVTTTNDIIPGKFNENQWYFFVIVFAHQQGVQLLSLGLEITLI